MVAGMNRFWRARPCRQSRGRGHWTRCGHGLRAEDRFRGRGAVGVRGTNPRLSNQGELPLGQLQPRSGSHRPRRQGAGPLPPRAQSRKKCERLVRLSRASSTSPLACDVHFRTQRHVAVALAFDDCSQTPVHGALPGTVSMAWSRSLARLRRFQTASSAWSPFALHRVPDHARIEPGAARGRYPPRALTDRAPPAVFR